MEIIEFSEGSRCYQRYKGLALIYLMPLFYALILDLHGGVPMSRSTASLRKKLNYTAQDPVLLAAWQACHLLLS